MAAVIMSLVVCLSGCISIEPILPRDNRANYGWLAVTVPEGELREVRQVPFGEPPSAGFRAVAFAPPEEDVLQGRLRFSLAPLVGFRVVRAASGGVEAVSGFYSVPGITQLRVVSSDRIEVNNLDDLVTIDTGDPEALKVLDRNVGAATFVFPDTKPPVRQPSPAPDQTEYRYFECIDPGGDVLVGWRLGYSETLNCYRTDG